MDKEFYRTMERLSADTNETWKALVSRLRERAERAERALSYITDKYIDANKENADLRRELDQVS